MRENKFILIRYKGVLFGVNGNILKCKSVKKDIAKLNLKEKSPYSGYRPCTFNEYLTNKV
jgi:hypothetical protein